MEINLEFRAANENDIPFLLALRNESMNSHILNMGLIPSEENHLERIKYRFECAQIIICNSSEIGLLKVVKENPVWDLVQIQLSPLYRNSGIGQTIIKQVLTEAFSSEASVKLSVFKNNPAKGLYEKLGFKTCQETDTSFEMQANYTQDISEIFRTEKSNIKHIQI